MPVSSRPIPALYTVYVLRSTMRHASLYIGSTTDPPRRLKQHNGEIKGGAARTSRPSLRPWEMVALVSGFPGAVAALKFEWALTNPHLSLHIPSESRLTVARQTKKNGHPRRPPASMQSVVANLHLLLRVPSFARWPLRLHMFAPEVHAAWERWCATANEPKPDTLELVTDFGVGIGAGASSGPGDGGSAPAAPAVPADRTWGIHALPLDYGPIRDYVDKAQDIFTFEREGDCAVCHEAMPPGQGLYAVCPNASCEAVGHLRCWSGRILSDEAAERPDDEGNGEKNDDLVPVRGHCPDCGGPVVWGDMMKELTLRMRAPKEVEKLVRAKRRQDKADKAAESAAGVSAAAAVDHLTEGAEEARSQKATSTKTTRAPKATKATKATKITKTARVTKATSITKATKNATGAAAAGASATLPGRADSPEVIIL